MPESPLNDRDVIALLQRITAASGAVDPQELGPSEIAALRVIAPHCETLVQIARYEEAKGLFWAHWRGLILGGAAVLSALLLFWANVEKLFRAAAKVLF